MFRKTVLALAATAALGAAALAPTSASAWGNKGWHPHHHGLHGLYGITVVDGGYDYVDACVMKKRWVQTPYGLVKRWVKVCY